MVLEERMQREMSGGTRTEERQAMRSDAVGSRARRVELVG